MSASTIAWLDPWVERQISAGRLAPDARGMSRAEAVRVLAQLVKRGIINVPLKRRA